MVWIDTVLKLKLNLLFIFIREDKKVNKIICANIGVGCVNQHRHKVEVEFALICPVANLHESLT